MCPVRSVTYVSGRSFNKLQFWLRARAPPPDPQEKLPTEERIRRRANDLYEQRGRADDQLDDWLEAEHEVLEDVVTKKTA